MIKSQILHFPASTLPHPHQIQGSQLHHTPWRPLPTILSSLPPSWSPWELLPALFRQSPGILSTERPSQDLIPIWSLPVNTLLGSFPSASGSRRVVTDSKTHHFQNPFLWELQKVPQQPARQTPNSSAGSEGTGGHLQPPAPWDGMGKTGSC